MNFFKIRIYFGFCDFLTFKSEYVFPGSDQLFDDFLGPFGGYFIGCLNVDSFRGVQNELITAGMSANKDIF